MAAGTQDASAGALTGGLVALLFTDLVGSTELLERLGDADVADARVDGERLRGRMRGTAAADWGILGPEGTFMLDVRSMETHDGALVYLQYHGRCDVSRGFADPGPLQITPRFETGDPRYAWLNPVQAVGRAASTSTTRRSPTPSTRRADGGAYSQAWVSPIR